MFFSPTKEKVLYGDDGVILEDGTKMTHEELEKNKKFLENTVHKLIDNSYFFPRTQICNYYESHIQRQGVYRRNKTRNRNYQRT